jgi:hypothetical protein
MELKVLKLPVVDLTVAAFQKFGQVSISIWDALGMHQILDPLHHITRVLETSHPFA